METVLKHAAKATEIEVLDPATGELWGNYPQTYSLVGTILCAVALSRPWSEIA